MVHFSRAKVQSEKSRNESWLKSEGEGEEKYVARASENIRLFVVLFSVVMVSMPRLERFEFEMRAAIGIQISGVQRRHCIGSSVFMVRLSTKWMDLQPDKAPRTITVAATVVCQRSRRIGYAAARIPTTHQCSANKQTPRTLTNTERKSSTPEDNSIRQEHQHPRYLLQHTSASVRTRIRRLNIFRVRRGAKRREQRVQGAHRAWCGG